MPSHTVERENSNEGNNATLFLENQSVISTATDDNIDNLPITLNFKTIATFLGATIGGLLFGYDTGVISGVLASLQPSDLSREEFTNFDKELITSITSLGSFFGSMLSFPIADHYGRRPTLAVCCVIFTIASIAMAVAKSLNFLIFGRLLVGFAIGIAAQCIPVYLSEMSPTKIRGKILALNVIAITSGQLFSYILAIILYDVSNSWRYLFAFAAIPAVLFLLLLDFIPESPRWLIAKGRINEASHSLKLIYNNATNNQVNQKLKNLLFDMYKLRNISLSQNESPSNYTELRNVQLQTRIVNITNPTQTQQQSLLSSSDGPNSKSTSTDRLVVNNNANSIFVPSSTTNDTLTQDTFSKMKFNDIFQLSPSTRRALAVGCILMMFQQISGFNAFMYYTATTFKKLHIKNPLYSALTVAATNFLFTVITFFFIDSHGRRKILLLTIPLMTFSLLLSSIGFRHNDSTLILISLSTFVAAYASGMGIIPWNSVEFLPLSKRAFGASCISSVNWLSNALISLTYLSMVDGFGAEATMLIFAIVTLLNWFFVWFWYPDVRGLSLEEIAEVFKDGIDINYVYRNYQSTL